MKYHISREYLQMVIIKLFNILTRNFVIKIVWEKNYYEVNL